MATPHQLRLELSQLWQPINTYLNRSLWHLVICEPATPHPPPAYGRSHSLAQIHLSKTFSLDHKDVSHFADFYWIKNKLNWKL